MLALTDLTCRAIFPAPQTIPSDKVIALMMPVEVLNYFQHAACLFIKLYMEGQKKSSSGSEPIITKLKGAWLRAGVQHSVSS